MASNTESELPRPTPEGQIDGTDVDSKYCEFCKAKLNGRNLILCFDGTSNQFGKNNTNVIELYSRIIKNDTQLTYYNSGIGTYARPSWRSYTYWKQVLVNKIDLAIAWNFEKVVLAGYRWLSDNYMAGDKIFLFGFSRGAYQVRVLAGMINRVGLILRGNEEQIPFAYELYADLSPKRASQSKDESPNDESLPPNTEYLRRGESSRKEDKESMKIDDNLRNQEENSRKKEDKSQEKDPLSQKDSSPEDNSRSKKGWWKHWTKPQEADEAPKMAQRFKETFSRRDVRVHFIGVWDTVSSVGVIRGKNLPGTDNFNPSSICYFRHALALDERRVKFLPEYICGGETYVDKGRRAISRVKEVWFAGCHSDIGGGRVTNAELNNASVPVLWMGNEALFAGLKLRNSEVVWKWDKLAETRPHESLRNVWHIFELLPFKRLSYTSQQENTWLPHAWKGRVIKPGQKIHASVSFIKDYKSKAKFSPGMVEGDWISLVNKGEQNNVSWMKGIENLLELDLFDYSNVRKIIEDVDLVRLEFVALTREGRQAIVDVDPEFTVLRNMLNDSDKIKAATCVVMLSKLATHDTARLVAYEKLFAQVMDTSLRLHGEEHPETLTSMANLASAYSNRGRWTEAEDLFNKVMIIRQRVLGAEHRETLTSMENLALTYSSQGQWEKAEGLFVQVVAMRKMVLGVGYPETLTSMANIVLIYRNQERWEEAERLAVQVVEIRKRVLGAEHPETLTSMENLALTYSGQGWWEKAEGLFVQVVAMRKRVLGAEHPETLTSTANIASIYRNQERWDEAEELEIQVLMSRRRVLGAEHPETLASMENLALIYSNWEWWEEAEELAAEVMVKRKLWFGEEHPETLKSMENLASIYRKWGRWWEGAELLFIQVMESRRKALGAEHPETLTSMANLALTYNDRGWWEEAEELEVEVLEMRKRVLGVEHPETLTSMAYLALTYKNQGWWKEAEKLFIEVMAIRKRVLGAEHPETLTSMENLASMYRKWGRWEEAEVLLTYMNQGHWKEAKELAVQVLESKQRFPLPMFDLTYRNQRRWKESNLKGSK